MMFTIVSVPRSDRLVRARSLIRTRLQGRPPSQPLRRLSTDPEQRRSLEKGARARRKGS